MKKLVIRPLLFFVLATTLPALSSCIALFDESNFEPAKKVKRWMGNETFSITELRMTDEVRPDRYATFTLVRDTLLSAGGTIEFDKGEGRDTYLYTFSTDSTAEDYWYTESISLSNDDPKLTLSELNLFPVDERFRSYAGFIIDEWGEDRLVARQSYFNLEDDKGQRTFIITLTK
jgi:hypothetical protein